MNTYIDAFKKCSFLFFGDAMSANNAEPLIILRESIVNH